MSDDIQLKAGITFDVDSSKTAAAQAAVRGVKREADGAADAVSKVRPGKEQGKDFDGMKVSAEKAFSSIDAARQVTQGGVMGLGQAVKNLGAQFASLEKMLGPVGLLLAAYASWKKVVDAVRNAHEQLAAGIRQTQLQNIEARIRRTAEAYDKEREAVERLADARRRLSDVEQAKDDARLRAQLAELELGKARERAALAPDDALGAKKLDLDYAERAANLKEASDRRRSDREETSLAAGLSDALDQRKLAQQAILALERDYISLTGAKSDMLERTRKRTDVWWRTGQSSENIWNSVLPMSKELDEAILKAFDKLQTAYKNRDAMELPIQELRGKREIVGIDRQTLETQSVTRQTDAYLSALEIARADTTPASRRCSTSSPTSWPSAARPNATPSAPSSTTPATADASPRQSSSSCPK